MDQSLTIEAVQEAYRSGRLTPGKLVALLLGRIAAAGDDHVWISRHGDDALRARAATLEAAGPAGLPLYGVPVAVKDNIDVAGLPTTAACPDFAYTPSESAPAVARLEAAGAIILGKTNLDQFATGLVGVRSPYGVARNPFNADVIPGGSSSGSAVAVAAGLAALALGTDTAGSGRVPAGFNNIVGLKPSLGLISTRGVVPACRSLDCVSIFALTVGDALSGLRVAMGFDAADPFARPAPAGFSAVLRPPPARFRFALPRPEDRRFFGNRDSERLFDAAIQRLVSLGGDPVEVDFQPLAAAAAVLYSPPGVAERTAAIETFLSERPDALLPVTRGIIAAGAAARAVDLHRARDKLRAARRVAEQLFAQTDCLLVPTAGTIYRIAEVEAEPLALNTNLGSYTNFVNQLDLAALAVPAGFQSDGLPFGVTLIGLAHREAELAAIGDALHRVSTLTLGASGEKLPPPRYDESAASYPTVDLVVFGAHLTGEPLNPELMALGGRFVGACRTAPRYRLFHIVDGGPSRPGLVRQRDGGTAIGGEIWRLPTDGFGAFVAQVKAPLAIGTVELDDGRRVKGFVCEGHAVDGAEDISAFGDWRRYRASTRSGSAAAAT